MPPVTGRRPVMPPKVVSLPRIPPDPPLLMLATLPASYQVRCTQSTPHVPHSRHEHEPPPAPAPDLESLNMQPGGCVAWAFAMIFFADISALRIRFAFCESFQIRPQFPAEIAAFLGNKVGMTAFCFLLSFPGQLTTTIPKESPNSTVFQRFARKTHIGRIVHLLSIMEHLEGF